MPIKLNISKKRNKHSFSLFMKLLSIVIAVVCVLLTNTSVVKYPFWILPVTYALLLNLIGKLNIVYMAPGIVTLNIVLFFRYSVLPMVLYISGELSVYAKGYQHVEFAVWIIWVELISIFATLAISGRRELKRKKYLNGLSNQIVFFELRYGNYIAMAVVGIVIVLGLNYRHLIGGFDLLTKGALDTEIDASSLPGVIGIIWQSCLAWLYVFVCSKLKKRELSGKSYLLLLLLISVGYILLTFIGQTSISRWYTVVSFIAVYYTIFRLFPNARRVFTLWLLVPTLLLIIVVSIYKNTTYLSVGGGMGTSFKELFNISTLDSYLAGPVSVNNAIYLKNIGEANFFSLFTDIINNMPAVNHWFDLSNSSSKLYASYMGRRDQILPLIGQSAIYFTYVFTPILSILAVWVMRKFDSAYKYSNTIMIFAYAFAAAWMALAIILNLAICLSWFYSRIFPLMLTITITEFFGLRQLRTSKIERHSIK